MAQFIGKILENILFGIEEQSVRNIFQEHENYTRSLRSEDYSDYQGLVILDRVQLLRSTLNSRFLGKSRVKYLVRLRNDMLK